MFAVNFLLFWLIRFSFAFYEESNYIIDLTEENFEKDVINGKDIWFIQFFSTDSNDCYEYSNTYEKVGKALNGFIKVAAVDVDKARLLAYRYNIKKLPTIIYLSRDKTSMKHRGAKTEVDLVNAAVKLISSHMNESLQEKFIDLPVVREFNQHDIEKHAKVSGRTIIAFYNSESTDFEAFRMSFTNLVNKLQDVIKFGYYDIKKFGEMEGVNSPPAIVYYFGKRQNRSALQYNGEMDNEKDLIAWAASNLKKPDVMELRDEVVLRDTCVYKKYCIITIIANYGACDKNCKKGIKEMLVELADRYKYYSIAWSLVRKNSMSILEDLFEINSETKLPIMLAVNVQNLRSNSLEDVDEAKAEEFLENIFHGNGLPERRLPGFDNLLQNHYRPWHDEL